MPGAAQEKVYPFSVPGQPERKPRPAVTVAPAAVPAGIPALAGEASEALYLRSIAAELMGSEDPRERLARALAGDEFLLYAQKILPLKSGAADPVLFEVLLRLREEEDNLLPPGGFIPIAERYGMMPDLDRWVMRSLMAWSTARARAQPAWRMPLFCVNLSEPVLGNADFARFVRSELQSRNFSGRQVTFEILEQDAINHHADVVRLMAALKPAGCRFTIDGFGSTKVSFSYLKGLQLDFIKIDGSIILNLLRDAGELAKTRAINTVCHKLGICTIAETVETREALTKLREIGVDYVQGFGIARPGPIAQQQ
jgi:EAL domain-containing protein (putative c-di-GMP-specific phosphodiesterase class I)